MVLDSINGQSITGFQDFFTTQFFIVETVDDATLDLELHVYCSEEFVEVIQQDGWCSRNEVVLVQSFLDMSLNKASLRSQIQLLRRCDFFVHQRCGESSEYIEHPSHSIHTLRLQFPRNSYHLCDLCRSMVNLCYRCDLCDFDLDLYCAKYPPPEVIDTYEMHPHKLTLLKEKIEFHCDAKCGKVGYGFPYKCNECDLAFHVDCVLSEGPIKHPSEVNHPYHPLHPLKLQTGQPPEYSDGKCLCAIKLDDRLFYHCSACNFSMDMRCVLNPPPQSVMDFKAHAHQLIFRPRLDSFTCNACGLSGDRSPYICVQCDFMIHQECLALPHLININRHDHRVSRTSVLGVVNSVCGVCRPKVDWTWGGYSCQRCPQYVVHSKCATRKDVWNGKELEGVPEEIEDIEPYVVIDDNTIQHFSHKEHYLRFYVNGLLWEENKRCSACTHPICLQSFYGCIDCDFILHQNCAESPRKKWHVLHNERLTLVTSVAKRFRCDACCRFSNGFIYQCGNMKLDVLCGSISEPFVHPSHPQHPLYYIPQDERKQCNGCNNCEICVLTCIESGCGFVLGFNCATLPQVVKHRADDHPLSLYVMAKRQVANTGVTFVRKKRIQRHGSTRVKITELVCIQSACWETLEGSCQEA